MRLISRGHFRTGVRHALRMLLLGQRYVRKNPVYATSQETARRILVRERSEKELPDNGPRTRAARLTIWMAVLTALFVPLAPEIGAAAGETVPTFTKNVAPIVFRNCVKCHAKGESAFRVPLTSYDAVQSQAEMIKQKVMAREMPPWPADPTKSVKFRNDARLSQQDIDTIVAWVNAGAPKGEDARLPPMPQSEDGWMQPQDRKPDLVIALPGDMHLPATGELPYMRLLIKVPFEDDRWVMASQTRPGNPAVVHHMAVTEVALPDGVTPAEVEQLAGMAQQMGIPITRIGPKPAVTTPTKPEQIDILGIYAPGSTLETYGEGSAKLLKGGKGMYLNFNVHYETTGKPETDRSAIAFWFQPGPPEHQLFRVNGAREAILANGKELLTDDPGTKAEGTHVAIPPIPPFAENYELIGMTAYPQAVTIYQFQPHAHHRAKDFTYTVVYPDGREETLLHVPKYDHRWQMAYEPETPVKLPAGSKLVVTAHYDNSTASSHNHAPDKPVYFRDQNQSWDEMFTPFIQYSFDHQEKAPMTAVGYTPKETASSSGQQEQAEKSALMIGEVVGCLVATPAGEWQLLNASQPAPSDTQATSLAAIKMAEDQPLGSRVYLLLGARVFQPASHEGDKVAVKGVLITDGMRINVTSLQAVGAKCTN